MSFFKRKEKSLIPPVEESSPRESARPGYRSTATTYLPSRDGDLYGTNSQSTNYSPSSTINGASGDLHHRSQPNVDRDREELLSGFRPENSRVNRFSDRPSGGGDGGYAAEPAPGEEQEEDVEGIKQQIRTTKMESVNSTRNALRLAREAEETARGTLEKLGDQSGSFVFLHTSQVVWYS
jgi:protein transport protein SEC9